MEFGNATSQIGKIQRVLVNVTMAIDKVSS